MEKITLFGRATFSSLWVRNYRLYFIGQGTSLCGTWMQVVALSWLTLILTGSGTALGTVIALQFLPMMLLGPMGGVIVDRFPKRKILFWTQIAFLVISIGIGALVYFDMVTLWMVYVFAILNGFIRVLDNPARQSFVSELVDAEHLRNAVSLNSTANNVARIVGPSIGGILIAGVGISFCFIVNGISSIALIVALRKMRKEELYLTRRSQRVKGQLWEGLVYVAGNPVIRNTLILIAIIGTFAYEFQVSLPLLAKTVFNGDAKSYAALLSAMGVGSIIGGLYSAGRHEVVPKQLIFFSAAFGISIIAAALAPTLTLAIVGMVVVGFFSISLTSLANTMIQLESVPQMRGRVMALWSTAMVGSTPIGGFLVGVIGEHFGARWALGIGGVATLIAVLPAVGALLGRHVQFWKSDEPFESEGVAEIAKPH